MLCSLDSSTVVYAQQFGLTAQQFRHANDSQSHLRSKKRVCLTRLEDVNQETLSINEPAMAEQEYWDILNIRKVESLPPDSGYFLVVGVISDGADKKHVQHLYHYDKVSGEFGRVGA
jgi:hypothetical protein